MTQQQQSADLTENKSTDFKSVPCNGCKLCCEQGEVALQPSDDRSLYQTHVIAGAVCIKRNADTGACIYLGENGCEIYDHRPNVCRNFDCRDVYAKFKSQGLIDRITGVIKPIVDKGASLYSGPSIETTGYFSGSQPRVLPNTFIAGVMRGGTTMLFDALQHHHQIGTAAVKEVNFWDHGVEHGKTLLEYGRVFPSILNLKDGMRRFMDASPGYSFHPQALKRLSEWDNEAFVILILRDPVERAVSHYKWLKRYGFLEDNDLRRFRKAAGKKDEGYVFSKGDPFGYDVKLAFHDIVARSIYDVQILRAKTLFNRCLIIEHGDLLGNNRDATLKKVYDFLEVEEPKEEWEPPLYSDKPKFDEHVLSLEDIDWLRNRLAPSVHRTADMNLKFSWEADYD